MSLNVFCIIVFVQYFQETIGLQLINNIVNNELYLNREWMYQNTTIRDCVWRQMNDDCSQDISLILYVDNRREVYDASNPNWLQNSAWNPRKKNVVLIHGYASGDEDPPLIVLRKAYGIHGGYNLFLIDYSKLSRPPCYVSAVNNLRYTSRCVGNYLNQLQRSGLRVGRLTCVGHSLGAIICGLLKDYLQFQLYKIIGLDPALPLIVGNGNLRLSRSDARFVHVLHTNAGRYGDVGSIGHVNVCVNGGFIQPYCFGTSNPHLCSHIWSLCYMSQSLFEGKPLMATKCSTYCPNFGFGILKFLKGNLLEDKSEKINVINRVPLRASGTYCLDNIYPPYCPQFLNGIGDNACCQFE